MNRIIYPLLLPVLILASAPVSASDLAGGSFTASQGYSDTTNVFVIAGSYSGRRTDSRAQQRLHENDKIQKDRAEFSAFETEKEITPARSQRQQHRYGGRGHDRHRMRH